MPPDPVKAQVSLSERFLEPVSLTEMFGLVAGNIQKAHSFSLNLRLERLFPLLGLASRPKAMSGLVCVCHGNEGRARCAADHQLFLLPLHQSESI